MSTGPLSVGPVWPDEIRRGADYVARLTGVRDGVAALVTASLRVLNPAAEAVWTGTATVTSGAAAVTIPASVTTSEDPATGWTLEWSYTTATGSDVVTRPLDIVLYTVKPVCTWSDLTALHVDLGRLTGDDLTAAQAKGDEAWATVLNDLANKGRRPCLIVDSVRLRRPHLLKWLALAYEDLATGGEDSSEARRAAKYAAEYAELWTATTFEQADPSTWQRTGQRVSTKGTLWLGSAGRGSSPAPLPLTPRP